MGKTLEILALVLSSKLSDPPASSQQGCHAQLPDETFPSRATLIVVPNHLVSQWLAEISRCVPSSAPSSAPLLTHTSFVYPKDDIHGRCAPFKGASPECTKGTCVGHKAHKDARIAELAAGHDIVVTTYQTLEKHKGVLRRVQWARVVMDEMQEIRSSTTELAKVCRCACAH